MLVVYSTTDAGELLFAQSMLSSAGITAYVADVYTSNIEGNIGIFPKRIMVANSDYEPARQVLIDNQLIDE